jgi:hypothetical protein
MKISNLRSGPLYPLCNFIFAIFNLQFSILVFHASVFYRLRQSQTPPRTPASFDMILTSGSRSKLIRAAFPPPM